MPNRSMLLAVLIAALALSAAPSVARAADGPEQLTFAGVLTGVGYGGGGGTTSYGPIDVDVTFSCTGGRCTLASFNGRPPSGPRAAWNFRGSSGTWSTPLTGDVCAMTEERAQSGTATLVDDVLTIVVETHSIPIVRCDEFRSREVGGNTDTYVLALVAGDVCALDNSCPTAEPEAAESAAAGPPRADDDASEGQPDPILITLLVVLGLAATAAAAVAVLRARPARLTDAARLFDSTAPVDPTPAPSDAATRRAMLDGLQRHVDISGAEMTSTAVPPDSTSATSDVTRAADLFAQSPPDTPRETPSHTERARRMLRNLGRYFEN